MPHELKDLGRYEATAEYVRAKLALQADFSDGHIDPMRGKYHAQVMFWSGIDGAAVEINYCTHGFKEVFEKLKPLTPGIDEIVKQQMIPPSQCNSGLVNRCINSLIEQTKRIAEINELPIAQTPS